MHNSIDLSERSSDNNKEKEEKKRENGIVTPECYHDPSYFLASLLPLLLLFSTIDVSTERKASSLPA